MKQLFISIITLPLFGLPVQALTYHCQVTQNNQAVQAFDFAADREPNKFVEINGDTTAGCLRFDSEPALLSCTLATKGQQYVTTTDLGVKSLSLAEVGGDKLSLSCHLNNK